MSDIVNRWLKATHKRDYSDIPFAPRMTCADGFSMSVQASSLHYCSPRENHGPWHKVEIGFPSAKVEEFMPYIDGSDDSPTFTVYGYVPVDIVNAVIAAHGGLNADCLSKIGGAA